MSLVIDIHALQTLPPSLINRDDTGAPKSAVFGGVPRQRVSSQSWKRAIRLDFEKHLPAGSVGFRTRKVVEIVANKIHSLDESIEMADAIKLAESVFKAAGIKTTEKKVKKGDEIVVGAPEAGYLVFLSPRQIEAAAKLAIEGEGKPDKKKAKEAIDTKHSIDIAMFGRMLADDPSYNVDASVQVAHALGIHESEPEFDYFTAVDDFVEDNEETGAGMIGTVQMMSSTLYRFATIDVESLGENLGDHPAAREAAVAFIKSFITSLPTGKQNTFANNTLPELVYAAIRDGRSVSLVNAFEEPVSSDQEAGRRAEGAKKLATEERQIEETYGFVPLKAFVMGLGELGAPFADLAEAVTLDELSASVAEFLEERSK